MKNSKDSLTTILTTSFSHEVHIAKTLLASNDINSFIFDENIDLVYGRNIFEGYKLKVNSLDEEKAREIIKELNFS